MALKLVEQGETQEVLGPLRQASQLMFSLLLRALTETRWQDEAERTERQRDAPARELFLDCLQLALEAQPRSSVRILGRILPVMRTVQASPRGLRRELALLAWKPSLQRFSPLGSGP